MPSTPTRSDADSAIARATLARFIAELVAEPDARWLARLADPEAISELRLAAATLCIDPRTLESIWHQLQRADRITDEHGHLCGHTVRSSCPPYELEYGSGEVFQQSQALADIGGFYRAFGMQLSGSLAERPDHIVPEWEFLSLLALKEARAIVAGHIDSASCCRDAQRSFLKDHAAAWMFGWFNRVRNERPDGFFSAVVNVAESVLREWCASRSVSVGADWLELRPVTDEDSTITCGAPGAAEVELGPRLAQALRQEAGPC